MTTKAYNNVNELEGQRSQHYRQHKTVLAMSALKIFTSTLEYQID